MTESGKPLFGLDAESLGHLPLSDLAIRFGFGAAISAIAAVVSLLAGSEPGGILLAFPAILPATLTLVEKEGSERKAEDLDVGAVMGAAALGAFALVVWEYIPTSNAAATLAVATAAWLLGAVGLYLFLRLVTRQRPFARGLAELRGSAVHTSKS